MPRPLKTPADLGALAARAAKAGFKLGDLLALVVKYGPTVLEIVNEVLDKLGTAVPAEQQRKA